MGLLSKMHYYVIAYTARRVDVSIILVSGENYGKKWMKILSLAGGRERYLSRGEDPKRKKSFEGSNDKRTPLGEVISRFDSNARNWY
jgi:hypothetical protein